MMGWFLRTRWPAWLILLLTIGLTVPLTAGMATWLSLIIASNQTVGVILPLIQNRDTVGGDSSYCQFKVSQNGQLQTFAYRRRDCEMTDRITIADGSLVRLRVRDQGGVYRLMVFYNPRWCPSEPALPSIPPTTISPKLTYAHP